MRIGAVYQLFPHYRAIEPLRAMERRGHQVVWPSTEGWSVSSLRKCDVIHVYRVHGKAPQADLERLVRRGIPLVYDNDDDMSALVEAEAPPGEDAASFGQRMHESTVRMARLAHTFTTTTETLAQKYREAGVKRVRVIANQLAPGVDRSRTRHDGVVIGWIAGIAHQPDIEALDLRDQVRRVLAKNKKARVHCIGVDLHLPEHYRREEWVSFEALPARIGGFDIGIAPMADIPVNRARSDIKLKEYAASGVPWLASPVGPYLELGEAQGGRLVADDEWFRALDALVNSRRDRKNLGRNAQQWAASETIDASADEWERVFADAAAARRPSR